MATTPKPSTLETTPYLKQARIRDYRSIRDAKVSFKPGLNIIIGENGAGKTNFTSLASRLINLYSEHVDGVGCEIILGGRYEVQITFEEILSKGKSDHADIFHLENDQLSILIKAAHEDTAKTGASLSDAIEDIFEDTYNTTNPIDYEELLINHGLPSSKLYVIDESTDLIISRRRAVVNNDSSLTYIGESKSNFAANILYTIGRILRGKFIKKNKLISFNSSIDESKEIIYNVFQAYRNQIIDNIKSNSPISDIELDKSFQVYYNKEQEEILIKGLKMNFYLNNTKNSLPFSALSDGTKRLFFIISELFENILFSDKDNPLRTRNRREKIIFLEEPELGIHHAQLTKLLNLIREVSKEHQVIMTTHAPQVLDMLTEKELDRITICELDPKKGTQFRKLSKIKQAQAREYMHEVGFLSDYWRYSFLEAEAD